MNTSNPELQQAEELVRHTDCNIFLTGKAGTGKTTFLHAIQKETHKRMVVTAPTGVAAINAGGVTLHSFFQMPFGPFVPGGEVFLEKHRVRREKKNIMRSLDLLVIDEISMVRADLLDGVDTVLRRYRKSDLPFGGVQLLMIGDLQQLSPVVKSDEWELLGTHYKSPYFFDSNALRRTELIPVELKHVYRQSDHHFIELLGRVRNNSLDGSTLKKLNSRYFPDFSPPDEDGYITLCTHNRNADAINEAKLNALAGPGHYYNAELEGDFPEYAYPTAPRLEVKEGAQVMFVRNDVSPEKRYFNGKIGTVTGVGNGLIRVRCPEDSETITVEKSTWENIEYGIDPETAEITQKVIGTFNQYPLKLAWAITIHKSQGLTFDKAVIDAQASFAHGQVYVALSRCRSFEGMVLSSPLTQQSIRVDNTVRQFAGEAAAYALTPEKVTAEKSRYQQRLLLECFSFERLDGCLGRLQGLLRSNDRVIRISGGGDISVIHERAGTEIRTVGEKFRRQLRGMFKNDVEPVRDPAILERLGKAAVYFQEKFDLILLPYIGNLAVDTDNKEIRKKISNAVKLLKEETAAKLAGVRSCGDGFTPEAYLRAVSLATMDLGSAKPKAPTVVYSEADVDHTDLFEILRGWRKQKADEEGVPHFQVLHQKTLVEIAIRLPDSISALKAIRGIGKRLAERYGEELVQMVTDYRREHGIEHVTLPDPPAGHPPEKRNAEPKTPKEKKDTKKFSFDLFQQGLSIPGIAAERGLALATIEGHLAHFVSTGELEIDRVVKDESRRIIEQKIVDMPGKSLKELKTALGSEYSYGDIKLVLAHLKRR